jgi:hypothetical protein
MCRAFSASICLAVLVGCQLPPEQLAIKPLPEDGPPQPYADLVSRARLQATAANEAFYVNRWSDLEDAAKGLEQTARFLPKAADIPAQRKATIPNDAGELGKDATKLREAAKAQQVKSANDLLQQINLKVRELRPDN